ncbi:unnamed protein product [Durusdinium trenchii]|uniref:Uncharacterized protein n=2 Tax=Durusdinium trenchii TaxID=1381693 RepID=A0ABP0Q7M0_9DINO
MVSLWSPWPSNLIAMKAVGGSPGGLKAAIPPKIFRPSRYQGALLLPSGEIHLESSMERHKLVEEFGLKPRDIAALVSKTRRGFDLNVRRGGTVLSLGRDGPAVVVANATALILPRGTEIQTIGHRIQQKYAELVDFSLPAAGVARESVPFALAVTEALLALYLDKITNLLQPAVAKANVLLREYVGTVQQEISTFQLEKLRRTKQRLDAVQSQAANLRQTLFEALGDEEDLSQLSSAVGATKEEWELCFEYYSQGAEEVEAEATAHSESMDDLETFIELRLSSRRLELEKSQLNLELLGVGMNCAAVISGIMGMNIESGLETRRPAFFYKFTLLLLLGSALVSVVLKTLVSRRLSRQANSLLPSSSWRSRRGREALPETGGPLSGKA